MYVVYDYDDSNCCCSSSCCYGNDGRFYLIRVL